MTFNAIIMYVLAKYEENPYTEVVSNNRKQRKEWIKKMTEVWKIIKEKTDPDTYEEAVNFFNMMDFCRYKAEEEE